MTTLLLLIEEIEKFNHMRLQHPLRPQNLPRRLDADLRAIQQPVGLGDCLDGGLRESAALERYDVDTPRPRRQAFTKHERRHIVQHAGHVARPSV